MKFLRFILFLVAPLSISLTFAQSSLEEDFNDSDRNVTLNWGTAYTGSFVNNEMVVDVDEAGPSWENFSINFPSLDLTEHPYVSFKIKASVNASVRIDMQDGDGKVTNGTPVVHLVLDNDYQEFFFDFTDRFNQSWPESDIVDPSDIRRLVVMVNPGGVAYTGTVTFDDLQIGSIIAPPAPPFLSDIFVNQIGYYPNGKKLAVVRDTTLSEFVVVKTTTMDTVFTGTLAPTQEWSYAGNDFRLADFSALTDTGEFTVNVAGFEPSHPFEIKAAIYNEVGRAGLKAYYYQRCSAPITAEHGGIFTRGAGHPDTQVLVHESAATDARPEGTIISSPRGWYDAGDYNKYIVNSGISTYTILALYEHFPTFFADLEMNIPESGDGVPDALDEALWNVRWMLSMQDPNDGGVYHKLTNETFSHGVLPELDNSTRYVVQKGTAATLDFVGVMAQSYRVFSQYKSEFPGLADSCLIAAQAAWNWAQTNPNVAYSQPAGFNTGVYGDNSFGDERNWAAAEMYITTKVDSFYQAFNESRGVGTPGWQNVDALPWVSLVMHRKSLTDVADTALAISKLLDHADDLRDEYESSAFGVAMGAESWNFTWGSNGVVGNQAMILLQAYFLTADSSYLDAAQANLDYLLGRNATGYCFLTGYGEVSPLHIHHRISDLDGIAQPVPGLIAGGPNPGQQDVGPESWACKSYVSDLPALSYLDEHCSYASNEITINWNAPFVYTALVLEALDQGHWAEPEDFIPGELCLNNCPIGLSELVKERPDWQIYPNPTQNEFSIQMEDPIVEVALYDARGIQVPLIELDQKHFRFSEGLTPGLYQVSITSQNGAYTQLIKKN